MKYPTTIRILGKDYKIVYVKYIKDKKFPNTIALHYNGEGIIKISTHIGKNRRCKDEIVESLLHECLHGLERRLKFNGTIGNEDWVGRYAMGIQALLKDNPKLKKLI